MKRKEGPGLGSGKDGLAVSGNWELLVQGENHTQPNSWGHISARNPDPFYHFLFIKPLLKNYPNNPYNA